MSTERGTASQYRKIESHSRFIIKPTSDVINADKLAESLRTKKDYRPTGMAIIFNDQGQILVTRSSNGTADHEQWWSLPQGGIDDPKRSVVEEIERELWEELDISHTEVRLRRYLGFKYADSSRPRDGYIKGKGYIAFLVDYHGNGQFAFNDGTVSAVAWVNVSELAGKLGHSNPEKEKFVLEMVTKAKAYLLSKQRRKE